MKLTNIDEILEKTSEMKDIDLRPLMRKVEIDNLLDITKDWSKQVTHS